jgi:hypothetical protein
MALAPDTRLYRRAWRGPAWAELSLRLRVVGAECQVCGRRPRSPARLQVGHAVAECELFALGAAVRDRHLLTEANLFVACKLCHFAFDLHVGVLDPARMTTTMCGRLRARYRRLEGRFRPLLVRRARFLARVLAELDRADTAGRGSA